MNVKGECRHSSPVLRHTVAEQVNKGEDFHLARVGCQHGRTTFDVFGVFDGHAGTAAAMFARDRLMGFVLEHVPEDSEEDVFVSSLPKALAEGFVCCDRAFSTKGIGSGTTASVAVVNSWTVTVASVGDSTCILDSQGCDPLELSVSHRLDHSPSECERVKSEGGTLERLRTAEGTERGPLRSYPGGVCVSRSLGDTSCGPVIAPLPHIKQVQIPKWSGGRMVLASDGLWDALSPSSAAKMSRGLPHSLAAPSLLKESIRVKGLRDDITVLVVDIMPSHLALHHKDASPVPKPKSFLQKLTARKKKPKEQGEGPVGPRIVHDQDSMQHSDLYQRYRLCASHTHTGSCVLCASNGADNPGSPWG